MAIIFEFNPSKKYDADLNDLIDQAESAKQPVTSPVIQNGTGDYILDPINKNGIIDFTNNTPNNFVILNNTGGFSSGDYVILALRGHYLDLIVDGLVNLTKFGDILTTLNSGQKYVLRNLGGNDWTLDVSGGGGGNNKLEIVQPSLTGTITDLNYVSNGDTNGIFYYLGTDGNTIPHVNPQNNNYIVVTTNSNISNPQNISDRSTSAATFTGGEGNYIEISIPGKAANLSLITLNINGQDPIEVEASMDGITWFTLVRVEENVTTGYHWRSLTPDSNSGYYQYFRIKDISTNGGNWNIQSIEFYGRLAENYNYELRVEDKGKLLYFANPESQTLTIDSNLAYSKGENAYLFLSHHTLELPNTARNVSGRSNVLMGLGRLYQIIKTSYNWEILLIADQQFGKGETNVEILNDDKILTVTDVETQRLDPNGSDRSIQLPPYIPGIKMKIINDSDGSHGLSITEQIGEQAPVVLLRLDNNTQKAVEIEASISTADWLINAYGSY